MRRLFDLTGELEMYNSFMRLLITFLWMAISERENANNPLLNIFIDVCGANALVCLLKLSLAQLIAFVCGSL